MNLKALDLTLLLIVLVGFNGFGQQKTAEGFMLNDKGEQLIGRFLLQTNYRFKSTIKFQPKGASKFIDYPTTFIQEVNINQRIAFKKIEKEKAVIWLKNIARVGELEFYENLETKPTFYYKKKERIIELSNEYKKVNLASYKVEGKDHYRLPGNLKVVVPKQGGGFKEKRNMRYLFDGELYLLRYKYLDTFKELGITVDTWTKRHEYLNRQAILKYSRAYAKNKGIDADIVGRPIQLSILGMYSPVTNLANGDIRKSYSMNLEVRSNRFMQNFSLGYGIGSLESETDYLYNFGVQYVPGLGNVVIVNTDELSSGPSIEQEQKINRQSLSFGYHFREGNNWRPFIVSRYDRYKILTFRKDRNAFNSRFGTPSKDIEYDGYIGIGLDFYTMHIFQFRIETSYPVTDIKRKALNLAIGMGFWF